MDCTPTPVAEPARLMDVAAVARLLGVSARHIYRLADGGRMPRPIKLGGAVRWDRAVITKWIDGGCPRVDRIAKS
jgi:excisionase family DNA binding protein